MAIHVRPQNKERQIARKVTVAMASFNMAKNATTHIRTAIKKPVAKAVRPIAKSNQGISANQAVELARKINAVLQRSIPVRGTRPIRHVTWALTMEKARAARIRVASNRDIVATPTARTALKASVAMDSST